MAAYKSRLKEFQDALDSPKIDLKHLRRLCFTGCPQEPAIRSTCWKVLLNYLPLNVEDWPEEQSKQRQLYQQFVDEMIVKPGFDEGCNENDASLSDHPLNVNPSSQWAAYFKDNETLLQIDKDCRRLCPDLSFFQSPTDFPCTELTDAHHVSTLRKRVEQTILKAENVDRNRLGCTNMTLARKKRISEAYPTLADGQEAHWEVCERILFIYTKLNPGLGYVQGMNEILGPIYYTFSSDASLEVREHAEADAFVCFTSLMSEIRDFFIKSLDDSQCGIGHSMNRLLALLHKNDYRLWQILDQQGLKPQFYAFRWITLLLSQEFSLPDVQRIWDSLLSDSHRFDFLIKVCCAMLLLLREELVNGDFPNNMKLIQNFPPHIEVQKVLSKALYVLPT